MTEPYKFRGYPWPHRFEGGGQKPQVEHYPFQGLDIATEPYRSVSWQHKARAAANLARLSGTSVPKIRTSGYLKYGAQFTPLGTSVAQLVRGNPDILSSPCGFCGIPVGRCDCALDRMPAGSRT